MNLIDNEVKNTKNIIQSTNSMEDDIDEGEVDSDTITFPLNPDGELDPAREHLKLYEERKDDFIIANWCWRKSEKEENMYLKGKSDLVVT